MALGSTQPLKEMSTRNISWGGKGSRCIGLTTLPPSCADCLEIWKPQTPGTPSGPVQACHGIAFLLYIRRPRDNFLTYFISHMEKCIVKQQADEFSESPHSIQHQLNAMKLGGGVA